MNVGERLRRLRGLGMLSQGDIEKRTGLLRCYISRVENGLTIPSVPTLEKLAQALEVPLYQFFYDREGPPEPPILPRQSATQRNRWKKSAKAVRILEQLGSLLSSMDDGYRCLLLSLAKRMVRNSSKQPAEIKDAQKMRSGAASRGHDFYHLR